MCGRAKLESDYSEIRIQFDLFEGAAAPNLRPNWNLAPTQDILGVLREAGTGRRLARNFHWGLVPSWAKEPKMTFATFNARAETVETAASFRGAWRAGRRLLLVVDGFYEWRKPDKTPFFISRTDGKLMAFGGLYEEWTSRTGEVLASATILTLPANPFMSALHTRMPLILAREDWAAWLGETTGDPAQARALIRPCGKGELTAWPVDPRIGNVRNNEAALSRAVGPALGLEV